MRIAICSIGLAATLVGAGGDQAAIASGSGAGHVVRSGDVRVGAPPQLAFQLFTAPGEELWVDDWKPVVLSGDGLERGTVFVTNVHEKTIWIVVDYDPELLHARYARVAPESRAGTVEVKVRSDGEGGSVAHVRYELTGLSDAGNQILAAMTEEAYGETMAEWETAIRNANIDYDVSFAAANQ